MHALRGPLQILSKAPFFYINCSKHLGLGLSYVPNSLWHCVFTVFSGSTFETLPRACSCPQGFTAILGDLNRVLVTNLFASPILSSSWWISHLPPILWPRDSVSKAALALRYRSVCLTASPAFLGSLIQTIFSHPCWIFYRVVWGQSDLTPLFLFSVPLPVTHLLKESLILFRIAV